MNTLVLLHADWCGHCQQFMSTWEELKQDPDCKKNNIKFVSIESQETEKLAKYKHILNGYPTIFKIDSHGKHVLYNGNRKLEDIKHFLNIKKKPMGGTSRRKSRRKKRRSTKKSCGCGKKPFFKFF